MSFFKELKEDIVQSVNELSDSLEETVSDTDIEESKMLEQEIQEEMDSVLDDEDILIDVPDIEDLSLEETDTEETSDVVSEEEPVPSDDTEQEVLDDVVEYELNSEEKQEGSEMKDENMTNDMSDTDNSVTAGMSERTDGGEVYNSEETTVITKGTTINGGIKSDTSLIVKGVIEGDVECQGKLTVTGRVAGNSTASEIYVNTPRLNGNLVSKGSVKVDVGTVVIGNISSASVVVAGAVKGDIDVNGPIVVDSTAVVQGSIIGKSIQINSGAVVDGMCSLRYADVDLDTFFE